MKSAIAVFIGFVLGCSGATAYWYYSLFVPWVDQSARSDKAEARLLNMYAAKLEAGEVEKVISLLKMDAKLKNEDGKHLNDHSSIDSSSP